MEAPKNRPQGRGRQERAMRAKVYKYLKAKVINSGTIVLVVRIFFIILYAVKKYWSKSE